MPTLSAKTLFEYATLQSVAESYINLAREVNPLAVLNFRLTFGVRPQGIIRTRWRLSRRHHCGSPVLHCLSSVASRPCYPGRFRAALSFSHRTVSGLPLLTTGSASPIQVTRLPPGSLRAAACNFAFEKLTTPDYSDAASRYYKGVRTTPLAGLQPAR